MWSMNGAGVGPELRDDEGHPLRHQAANEGHVAGQPVELGHDDAGEVEEALSFFDAPGIPCEFNRPCEYRNYAPRHRGNCGRSVIARYWETVSACWVMVVVRACDRAWPGR
jgi:hypothetical protein